MNDIKTISSILALYAIAFVVYQYAALFHYAFIGTFALGGIVAVAYTFSFIGDKFIATATKYQEMQLVKADVKYREAETKAIEQVVTVVKPGHGVVVTNVNAPMMITAHSLPFAEKVSTVAQLPAPLNEDNVIDGIKTGEAWIEDTLFNPDGSLKAYHVKGDGITGSGKTHLMLYIMSLLQKPYPKAEYWLLDPKFEGASSGWPFEPFVTDFDEMAAGAEYLYQNVVVKRKHDKRLGIMPSHPAFFIFDEADGSFDEHGEKFTKPVRRIIKEARSVLGSALVIGQSPLIKENGFSSAIFRNTARFVLGMEAVAYIRNPQFNHFDKPLRTKLHTQLTYLQDSRKRSCLVIPANDGLPFVAEIPNLAKPYFKQVAKVDEAYSNVKRSIFDTNAVIAKPTEQEQRILDLLAQGVNVTNVGKAIYGSKGGEQNENVRLVAAKFNVEI